MAYRDCSDSWLDETTPLDDSPERADISGPVIEMEETIREVRPQVLAWTILRGGSFHRRRQRRERADRHAADGTSDRRRRWIELRFAGRRGRNGERSRCVVRVGSRRFTFNIFANRFTTVITSTRSPI